MPKPTPMTYERHEELWKNCQRCELKTHRRTVVLARGKIPCEILFVGEAPGENEDVWGEPFVGPAGIFLDELIDAAKESVGYRGSNFLFSNLLACVPRDEFAGPIYSGKDLRNEWIEPCKPRLDQLINLAKPKKILAVGKRAELELGERADDSIIHPAAILRANLAQKGILVQQSVVTIANLLRSLR